jgi:threonine dehydratase
MNSTLSLERPWNLEQPRIEDVREAKLCLAKTLKPTPLLENERVNDILGARLLLKAEGLQPTGSFKVRGAFYMVSLLARDGALGEGGLLTFSSGNHGQAVAWAARKIGVPAVVLMPHDAPVTKVRLTKAWGAEVIFYNRPGDDREVIGRSLACERDLTIIPPFEDRRIVAGAGTLALEVLENLDTQRADLDMLVTNCSGGGMAAGSALVASQLSPNTKVWTTEPVGFEDLQRSLAAGRIVANSGSGTSICDSLIAPKTGELTFGVMSKYLSGAAAVEDEAVLQAMQFAFDEYRVVVEPGGAAGLAAVLSGKIDVKGKTVAVVLSGSNVDRPLFDKALAARPILL